jgi:hypothetical protein
MANAVSDRIIISETVTIVAASQDWLCPLRTPFLVMDFPIAVRGEDRLRTTVIATELASHDTATER